MTIRFVLGLVAGAFAVIACYATAAAQAPASASAGVYTAEQSKRGAVLYGENCASCHGDTLAGNDPIPGLSGDKFQGNWKSVGDLFDKTSTSMPAMAPGSLTGAQVADVLAYILSVNKYPAGTTELPSKVEPLMQIKIEPIK
jgi:S-disulfanyl-L-cysteine oxidoreductase SoxD